MQHVQVSVGRKGTDTVSLRCILPRKVEDRRGEAVSRWAGRAESTENGRTAARTTMDRYWYFSSSQTRRTLLYTLLEGTRPA